MKAFICFAIVLLSASSACWSEEESRSWNYDFDPGAACPAWVKILPAADKSSYLGSCEFQVTPPDDHSELLVTVNFEEQEGGFLRAYWASDSDAVMLSDNLYEGIAMANSRSISLPPVLLKSGGVLTFQSSQPDLHVLRIHMEWMTPRAVPVADSQASQVGVVDATGQIYSEQQLSGDPELPELDSCQGYVVTAPLTEGAERIETGVEFEFELESAPALSRLETQLAGVPIGQNIVLWINKKWAGTLSVSVPDLNDPRYQMGTDGVLYYAGWRKAALIVPSGFLQAGTNSIELYWEQTANQGKLLAVKNLKLQLQYNPPPVAQPGAVDALSSGNADLQLQGYPATP